MTLYFFMLMFLHLLLHFSQWALHQLGVYTSQSSMSLWDAAGKHSMQQCICICVSLVLMHGQVGMW